MLRTCPTGSAESNSVAGTRLDWEAAGRGVLHRRDPNGGHEVFLTLRGAAARREQLLERSEIVQRPGGPIVLIIMDGVGAGRHDELDHFQPGRSDRKGVASIARRIKTVTSAGIDFLTHRADATRAVTLVSCSSRQQPHLVAMEFSCAGRRCTSCAIRARLY